MIHDQKHIDFRFLVYRASLFYLVDNMDSIPLVIVEGFMSSAGALVWGNFEQHLNHDCESRGELRRRTIFAR